MLDLRGKTVWITGASSGIGRALAQRFAERGARLLLSARRQERLVEVARACGPAQAEPFPLDLEDVEALAEKARQAEARVGPIDIMVHNAGVGQRGSVLATHLEVEERLMRINYLAPVALTKALLPGMLARGGGRFVVMSSVLGLLSVKNRAGYCASKHALHGYFNALRAEHAQDGISVLLVCPGHVNTEFSLQALEADGRAHGVVDPGQASGITPERCAERTLRALDAGRHEVYVGKWESLGVYLNRYAPALLRPVLARAKAR
jgi:dehydrogenase/reductase SDR family protein 7B